MKNYLTEKLTEEEKNEIIGIIKVTARSFKYKLFRNKYMDPLFLDDLEIVYYDKYLFDSYGFKDYKGYICPITEEEKTDIVNKLNKLMDDLGMFDLKRALTFNEKLVFFFTYTKAIFTNKLADIVYKYLSAAIKNITEEKIIEESNKFITNKRKMKSEIEMLKKEIEIKKTNIKNLYLQKVNNQITIEIFTQKRNEINEQIKEREKRISQISEYIDEEIQKQEIREQFKKFKNENNLMKYIHDLVKSINFYKDGKIEIMLSFGE